MLFTNRMVSLLLPLLAAAFLVAGCAQQAEKESQTKDSAPPAKAKESGAKDKESQVSEKKGHGEWCDEHGVWESICTRCNGKLTAKFKKKGDWCEEHERPKSQCFKCNPKLQEKYAAEHKAKFGEKPPPITDP